MNEVNKGKGAAQMFVLRRDSKDLRCLKRPQTPGPEGNPALSVEVAALRLAG